MQNDERFAMVSKKDEPRMVQIKASKAGDQLLLAQVASDNHIIGLGRLLVEVVRVQDGTKEDEGSPPLTVVKHDLKHFRHSLDDSYMMWRSGDSNLIIFDVFNNKSDEIIHNFWKHQDELTKPISTISTADAYKILGISQSMDKKSFLVHYYERNDQTITLLSEFDRKAIDPLGRN